MSPPSQCTVNALRRLRLPLESSLSSAWNLFTQPSEAALPAATLQALSLGLGRRLGLELTVTALRPAVRQLSDVISLTTSFLSGMQNTKFPKTMCPMGISPKTSPAPATPL
jgi:hypothetical protein